MNEIIVAPSLLASDFANLEKEIQEVEKGKADWLHLDVMDGMFVPNISFGPCVIGALKGKTNLFFDVHLMINEPIRYLADYKKAGADLITIHYEACEDVEKTIAEVKKLGCKVGLSISPETPAEKIYPYLKDVDLCLVMTVHPGFGGQSFIAEMLVKMEKITAYKEKNHLDFLMEVDGGISAKNVKVCYECGARVFVAGSSIFKAEDKEKAIKNLREAIL